VQLHYWPKGAWIAKEWDCNVERASYRIMNYSLKKLLVLICLAFISVCDTEDILGCGGFVKSDIDINFSRVEVKL
jgi:hypothetical protein